MDIEAIIEALAPDHDAKLSNIEVGHEIIEQLDGMGNVCHREIRNERLIITIDLMKRTPDAE